MEESTRASQGSDVSFEAQGIRSQSDVWGAMEVVRAPRNLDIPTFLVPPCSSWQSESRTGCSHLFLRRIPGDTGLRSSELQDKESSVDREGEVRVDRQR